MLILAIETSCDETAISIIRAYKLKTRISFEVLSHKVHSQMKLHAKYGGVFPMMAKREHIKNLLPVLNQAINCKIPNPKFQTCLADMQVLKIGNKEKQQIRKILERENNLAEDLIKYLAENRIPKFDLIAVTQGPGLEPALWTGINFARALSYITKTPIVGINHMEGHLISAMAEKAPNSKSQIPKKSGIQTKLEPSNYHLTTSPKPSVCLLASGGHTELILVNGIGKYKKLGQTRDDAVGEAFDKAARILGLPYPGGPQISLLASKARKLKPANISFTLPRPMLHSNDLDFSYSGLKTALLYAIQKIPKLEENLKLEIAREFEDAAIDVLIHKLKKSLLQTHASSILLGGGVIANKELRKRVKILAKELNCKLGMPEMKLATDNATMIGLASFFKIKNAKKFPKDKLTAKSNWSIESKA